MKRIIIFTLLFISLMTLHAETTAQWTDPEQLKKEPQYFTNADIVLPPGRFSLSRMLKFDPDFKNMRCVEFDTLASRFSYQNFKNCINLVVKKGSPQEKLLEQSKRQPVQLTFSLKKRTRMRGGVDPFTYYLGIIKAIKVLDPKKMPVKNWSALRAFWSKNVEKEANVFLKIKGFAPEKFQIFKEYLLLDAMADPDIEAGSYKYPGRNLNPALPKDKKLYLPIMKQAKSAEVFFIAKIKIISLDYKHKRYGNQPAGLGVVLNLTPLKTAVDFGAPKRLDTTLAKLEASQLTDPVALTKTPQLFIGQTHLIHGDVSKGNSFTKDKQLNGYHTVKFSSLASNFQNNATGGDVVLVYKDNSAVARTLNSFPHQHPVILKIDFNQRRRKLGGVLELEYYMGVITDVKEWPEESWGRVRNRRKKLVGKDVWVYLQAMEQVAEKNQQFGDYIMLNAKYTSQHTTGNLNHLVYALTPALAKDGTEGTLLKQMAVLEGFCRAKITIVEKEFIPNYGNKNPKKTHLGVIKVIQPLKTASSFGHDAGNPLIKDDILRTWTPFRKLTPRKEDLKKWFKQTEKKVKRRQYDDLSRKKDPQIAYKSKYRYKKNAQWIYSNEPPSFPAGERPYQIWKKGIRRVTKNNVSSFMGGGSITYINYGSSTVSITTWYRQLYNKKEQTWTKPSTKATITKLKELEQQVLKILPERNRQIKIILEVEESGKIVDLRNTVGGSTEVLDIWERSGSYNSPAGKKRIANERKKLEQKKIKLQKLEAAYTKACKEVESINKSYQQLLGQATEFAEGKKELLAP